MSEAAVTRFARTVILTALFVAAAWIAPREPGWAVHASPESGPAAQSQVVGQGQNRAAVVVKFESGQVETRCVAFTEDSIGGDELLTRSGLNPELSSDGAVCSISGQGCPPDDCFCRCPSFDGECQYWSFSPWEGGAWVNSSFGTAPSSYVIANGGLHGWSWGPGDASGGAPAPDVTYDQICPSTSAGQGTSTPTATPTSTSTATVTATPTLSGSGLTQLPVSPTASLTATPRAIATQDPRALLTLTPGQQGPVLAPARSASPLPPGPLQGGVRLAPTAEPPPIVTPSPQPTPTPYQFSLPATETPRPRRVLSAESGPTPTPLLLARAPGSSGQAPAANAGNASPAAVSGSESLVQTAASARSFSPELLPGYAAFIVTVAVLLLMAWYALHRRNRLPPIAVPEPDEEEGRATRAAGRE